MEVTMFQKKGKMALIQVFRGIAALIVVFHHASLALERKNIFEAGWIGVDFFFVLSGFIIYYIHYKDFGKRGRLKNFYLKRFIRVYPIYWIVIPVVFYWFYLRTDAPVAKEFIVKSILLFPQATPPIVDVAWTLVYEIFFYLVFSFLILFKPKVSFSIITLWVTSILLNSFGLLNLKNSLILNFIFSNNHIEFVLGCVTAYVFLSQKIMNSVSVLVLGLIGVLYGWMSVINGNILRGSTESMLTFGISFSLLVLAAATIDRKKSPKIPGLLLLLGDASYSIYLTHTVIIHMMLNKHFFSSRLSIFMQVTLFAILTGIIFHLLIEKPLLKILNKIFIKKHHLSSVK